MEVLQRLARAIHYNIVLYMIACAAMLYVITSPLVAGPILNFCFAGIVPGTDIIVAPDTMLLGELIILSLIIVFAVLLWLRPRLLARLSDDGKSDDGKMSAGPVEIHTAKVRPASAKSAKVLDSLLASLSHLVLLYFYGTSRLWDLLQIIILRGLFIAATAAYRISLAMIIFARFVGASVRITVIEVCLWLVPRLRQIDHWLEIRIKTGASRAGLFLMRFETVQVGRDIVREGSRSVRERFKLN